MSQINRHSADRNNVAQCYLIHYNQGVQSDQKTWRTAGCLQLLPGRLILISLSDRQTQTEGCCTLLDFSKAQLTSRLHSLRGEILFFFFLPHWPDNKICDIEHCPTFLCNVLTLPKTK